MKMWFHQAAITAMFCAVRYKHAAAKYIGHGIWIPPAEFVAVGYQHLAVSLGAGDNIGVEGAQRNLEYAADALIQHP